jgi:translocation and assembly module TamB
MLAILLALGAFTSATAQDGEEEERSRFVRLVERQISTPDRQIRLGGIEGALSSDVRISSITVSDREGEWLRIEDVHLVWSRTSLLRRRLEIELLEAGNITVARPPLPAEGPSEPFEERTIELPEFPVTLNIETVRVPRVEIAQGVIGPQGYALALEGSTTLDDGTLDADLAIERLDEAGTLRLATTFSNETRLLDLDLLLAEPENGVVANLLNLEGRPAVSFAIRGSDPIEDFSANIELIADDEQILEGNAAISRTEDAGFRFVADVGGNLEPLVPSLYREFVDQGSRLVIDATRAENGAIRIAQAELTSGVAALKVSGELTPDGVPTALVLEGVLNAAGDVPIHLPGLGGEATVRSGRIAARLGGEASDSWTARFELQELVTPTITAEQATVAASGIAANMADPDARRVTFEVSGSASGLASEVEEIAAALGDTISVEARGEWSSGDAVTVESALVKTGNATLGFAGRFDADGGRAIRNLTASIGETSLTGDLALLPDGLYSGTLALQSPDLSSVAPLLSMEASGTLSADIELSASDGRQLAEVAAEARDLEIEDIAGGIAVGSADIRLSADDLFGPSLIGQISATAVRIGDIDLPLVDLQATRSGDATLFEARAELADGSVLATGSLGAAEDAVVIGIEALRLLRADIEANLVEPFEVALRNGRVTITEAVLQSGEGRVAVSGEIGDALALSARLDALPLALLGAIQPDFEAAGTLSGTLEASGTPAAPIASFDVEGTDINVVLLDLLGIDPITFTAVGRHAEGTLTLDAEVDVGGRVVTVAGSIGEALDVTVGIDALPLELVNAMAPDLDIAGTVSGRLRATGSLDDPQATFELQGDGITTGQLRNAGLPGIAFVVAGRFEDDTAVLTEAVVEVDGGRIVVEGRIGQKLDVTATLAEFPLLVASAVWAELDLDGTVSGTVSATGSLYDPEATFELQGSGIASGRLGEFGLPGLELAASGRFEDGTALLQAGTIEVGDDRILLEGRIGDPLDLTATFTDFPASVANAVQPDLDLSGSVSGTVNATGSLEDPQFDFEIRGTGISAAPLRGADIPGADVPSPAD